MPEAVREPGAAASGRRRRLRVSPWLAGIVCVALVLRVTLVLATPHYRPMTDSADYDRIAVSLADQHRFPDSVLALTPGPTAFRGPTFPIALGAVYKLVGTSSASTRWEAGRLMQAVLGTVAVLLIYLIAARLWNRAVARAAGGIAAVYPPLVLVGSSLMSEPLFIALMLGAVLAALVHRDSGRRWRWALASGVLLGLAGLTRANGLLLAVPLCLLVWSERPRWSRRSVRAPLALLAATLATLTPWLVRDANVFGAFVPVTTEGGYATAGTYNPYAAARTDFPAMWTPPVAELATLRRIARNKNELQISDRLNTMALDYIKAHPGYVAKVALWSTIRLFNLSGTRFELSIAPYEVYPRWLVSLSVYTFWALGLLAIAGAFARAARRVPWAVWGCPLAMLLPTVFIIGATRYRSPADPFFVMLAALAVIEAWRRVRRRAPAAAAPA